MYFPLAWYSGYCVGCDTEQPLVLVEHGPRGLRSWLAGHGPEDRTLRYSCRVCGRNEHVPLTEAEDLEYEATLQTWPDTFRGAFSPVSVSPDVIELSWEGEDVAATWAKRLPVTVTALTRPRPVVRVVQLPTQRVSATDDLPLSALPVAAHVA